MIVFVCLCSDVSTHTHTPNLRLSIQFTHSEKNNNATWVWQSRERERESGYLIPGGANKVLRDFCHVNATLAGSTVWNGMKVCGNQNIHFKLYIYLLILVPTTYREILSIRIFIWGHVINKLEKRCSYDSCGNPNDHDDDDDGKQFPLKNVCVLLLCCLVLWNERSSSNKICWVLTKCIYCIHSGETVQDKNMGKASTSSM